MFCMKCGSQMPEDAAFCAACGAPLIQSVPTEPSQENASVEVKQEIPTPPQQDDLIPSEAPVADNEKKKPKKKKTLLIASICAVAFVLLLAVAAFFVCLTVLQNKQQPEAVWAFVDDTGTAYLCYGNGKKLSINGVDDAFMTPDQKKVVVLEEGGDLYWTDVKLSEKHVIMSCSKNEEIELDDDYIYNDSFLYLVEDISNDNASVYRYRFDDESNVMVACEEDDDIDSLVVTEGYSYAKSASVAIARNGWIEVLSADSDEFKKLTKYEEEKEVELLAIAPNGSMLIWAIETDDSDYTVYYSYNDTVTKLKSSVEDVDEAAISADNRLAFVFLGQDLMYIRGEEYETVHFSGEINGCYTEDGRDIFDDTNTRKDQGFFVSVEGKGHDVLYYVDFDDATKYKLIDAETIYIASESKIVYQNDGGRYIYAEFDKKDHCLGKEYTITSADNVILRCLEECSDYILYSVKDEDYDAGIADIYIYDTNKNQSKKIVTEVFAYASLSTDGTKFFYFEDLNEEDATGTLMLYDIKKEESEQIATDVLVYSVTSYFLNGTIDPNAFFYLTGDIVEGSDVHFYNGKKSSVIVSDLEY